MLVTSPAFDHNGKIPSEYTCDGADINPELNISGLTPGMKSLVLIMDDPDVPKEVRKDQMWVHWVIFNMPPNTSRIPKNSQPQGTPGMNTRNQLTYQGPCPPDREHRYYFKLYALDIMLDLPRGTTKENIEKAMEGHIIAKAELIGRYERLRG